MAARAEISCCHRGDNLALVDLLMSRSRRTIIIIIIIINFIIIDVVVVVVVIIISWLVGIARTSSICIQPTLTDLLTPADSWLCSAVAAAPWRCRWLVVAVVTWPLRTNRESLEYGRRDVEAELWIVRTAAVNVHEHQVYTVKATLPLFSTQSKMTRF